ncbi:phosphotransferase family protein [Zhongshania sp.]|jgi:aminoglycoside phosphotransferase (APT) family kinase protein|uniref:phosphotransferase family protein n=1 Tax=Zhongshania sp. TaxID=1971902 RepID=UPI002A7F10D0|nr:phosphotransferase family protein [Zhongshania sp.]
MGGDLEGRLSKYISQKLGAVHHICDMLRLTGGAVNETWRFRIEGVGCNGLYILRLGRSENKEGLPKSVEAQLQIAALGVGVPVARVLWIFDPSDGFGEGYIMDCVRGESIPKKILHEGRFDEVRPTLASQCGEIAAKIHSLKLSDLPKLPSLTFGEQIAYYAEIYDSMDHKIPTFELAIAWLSERSPRAVEPCMVHGDYRNGNFIVNEKGVSTVLDWELAHSGDPMEDLGWFCVNSWRFGNRRLEAGGFGTRYDLFKAYEGSSGKAIDEVCVSVWEALGTFKWGVMCLMLSGSAPSGTIRNVESSAIGRRVSETEIDLLDIIYNRGI